MPTAQERYDIERKREIKNVPLLKTLKALIDNAAAHIVRNKVNFRTLKKSLISRMMCK